MISKIGWFNSPILEGIRICGLDLARKCYVAVAVPISVAFWDGLELEPAHPFNV